MRTRRPVLLLLLSLLPVLAGCAGFGGPNERVWTRGQPHEALRAGVTVRESYCPSICPCVPDTYVARRDGSFVKTFCELRAVLRPLDTVERALAYRDLLDDVELERDETLRALQHTTPLTFDEGEGPFYGVYVAADAQRWNVGTEPVIQTVGDAIVITQPSFRMAEYPPAEGEAWDLNESCVELVRETIHRDGRYEREVVHAPAPIL